VHPDPDGSEIICKLGSGSVINSGSDSGSGFGSTTPHIILETTPWRGKGYQQISTGGKIKIRKKRRRGKCEGIRRKDQKGGK
jgi:hypothetical protein